MLKKILAITALYAGLAFSASASAMDLTSAFTTLTGTTTVDSTQAAAVYKSADRTSVDLGGVEMKVPRSSVNLFSITPPSISAGCSGISAHFGGFSFISGSQIQQFISNIEQGIPGAVLQLAIKLLCPQCEAVLQAMEKLAQDAAKMAMDSCHVSTQIASTLMNSTGMMPNPSTSNSATNFCARQQADTNAQSDSLMAELSSSCASANSALTTVVNWAKSSDTTLMGTSTTAQKLAQLSKQGLIGNETWNALGEMGWCPKDPTNSTGSGPATNCDTNTLHTKLMLMNLLGTTINNVASTSSSTASGTSTSSTTSSTTTVTSGTTMTPVDNQTSYPPTNTVKNLYDMFMCGNGQGMNATYNTHSIMVVCQPFWTANAGSSPLMFYDCANNDYQQCMTLMQVSFTDSSSKAVTGPGFIYQVTALLEYGVTTVASGKQFDWTSTQAQQLAQLLSTAPYPLYQAINAAAVYPTAASDLVDSLGLTTAELMTYAFIEDMLSYVGRSNGEEQSTNPQMLHQIQQALAQVRTDQVATMQTLSQQVSLQEAVSREIVQVNQTIQRQVMSSDFLGNSRFATALVPPTTTSTTGSN